MPLLAFGPHVDTGGLRAARQAGVDFVYPRSKFMTRRVPARCAKRWPARAPSEPALAWRLRAGPMTCSSPPRLSPAKARAHMIGAWHDSSDARRTSARQRGRSDAGRDGGRRRTRGRLDAATSKRVQSETATEDAVPADGGDDGAAHTVEEATERTRKGWFSQIGGLFKRGGLDEELWEELEETLVLADTGAQTTMRIIDDVREQREGREDQRSGRGAGRAQGRDGRRCWTSTPGAARSGIRTARRRRCRSRR